MAESCTQCQKASTTYEQSLAANGRPMVTAWWDCSRCGRHIERVRGGGDTACPGCGAEYNAFGQRLRDGWQSNPSNYDDEVDDMTGYAQTIRY